MDQGMNCSQILGLHFEGVAFGDLRKYLGVFGGASGGQGVKI